jgi:hypothetical protein
VKRLLTLVGLTPSGSPNGVKRSGGRNRGSKSGCKFVRAIALHLRWVQPPPMIESFSAAAMDVLQDRILPLVLARVGQAVVNPDSWGVMELVIVGLFTQIGLEVYKHGVPEVFSRWKHLPARGKPLEVLESRDRQFIAFSQIAIVVMTFHYLQVSQA